MSYVFSIIFKFILSILLTVQILRFKCNIRINPFFFENRLFGEQITIKIFSTDRCNNRIKSPTTENISKHVFNTPTNYVTLNYMTLTVTKYFLRINCKGIILINTLIYTHFFQRQLVLKSCQANTNFK